MRNETLVLAGNFEQARRWASERSLGGNEWTYVSSGHWLRGRGTAGVPRVVVGTFWERRDAARIAEALEIADLAGRAAD